MRYLLPFVVFAIALVNACNHFGLYLQHLLRCW